MTPETTAALEISRGLGKVKSSLLSGRFALDPIEAFIAVFPHPLDRIDALRRIASACNPAFNHYTGLSAAAVSAWFSVRPRTGAEIKRIFDEAGAIT